MLTFSFSIFVSIILYSVQTGTLTQNRMQIVHVAYDQEIFLAPTATQQATYSTESETYKNLFYLAANCVS